MLVLCFAFLEFETLAFKKEIRKIPPPPSIVSRCVHCQKWRVLFLSGNNSRIGLQVLKSTLKCFILKFQSQRSYILKKVNCQIVFLLCAERFQRQRAFFNNIGPVYRQEYLPCVLYYELISFELDMTLRVCLGVLEKTWIAKLHAWRWGKFLKFSCKRYRFWLYMCDKV